MIPDWKRYLRSLLGDRRARYLIAGVINTAFSFAFYPALLWAFPYFQTHFMWGLAIAQPMGVIFSFMTQKFGVFRTKGGLPKVVAEFARYASFYLVYFALNWATLPILVKVVGISPVIAQTLFLLIVVVAGYFWHDRVTFEKEAAKTEPNKATACE